MSLFYAYKVTKDKLTAANAEIERLKGERKVKDQTLIDMVKEKENLLMRSIDLQSEIERLNQVIKDLEQLMERNNEKDGTI